MEKYYISNESSWQTQKSKQEKIGQGGYLFFLVLGLESGAN